MPMVAVSVTDKLALHAASQPAARARTAKSSPSAMSLRYASLGDLAATRLAHFEAQLVTLSEDKLLGKLSEAQHATAVDVLLPDNPNAEVVTML